jgi:hypothetical protein
MKLFKIKKAVDIKYLYTYLFFIFTIKISFPVFIIN